LSRLIILLIHEKYLTVEISSLCSTNPVGTSSGL
jgi:hypothetical protein